MPLSRTGRWGIVAAVLGGAALVWLLREPPIAVETALVVEAPLRETVGDEGTAEVRHRHLITAPVGGEMARLALEVGDTVAANATVATLRAAPLDARTRAQAEAALASLRDGAARARTMVKEAEAALMQARRDRERAEPLVEAGAVARADLERLRLLEAARREALAGAQAAVRAADHDVEAAAAVLRGGTGSAAVAVRCPVGGVVLRIPERSARVVQPGETLLVVGDPAALEVVVDLPSDEAVRVQPGMPMRLTGWGGDSALTGRVRRVDPAAFTKTSALGVDEQRVRIVGDFDRIPTGLGDQFRLDVEVVTWAGEAVRQIPASALIRDGDGWAVFVVEDGRARRRAVTIGHQSPDATEVVSGLELGEVVVRHPGSEVRDGVRVKGGG